MGKRAGCRDGPTKIGLTSGLLLCVLSCHAGHNPLVTDEQMSSATCIALRNKLLCPLGR
jgi:hypothetical protein